MSHLRRTGPPERRTPLTSSKPLSRTPLARSVPLPRSSRVRTLSEIRASRPTVSREEREGRKLLRARSQGRCEIGGTCPAQEAHHRKNRSQGGTWAVENLLHLCHAHHLHVTTNPTAARQQGWAVRSTHDPAAVPVWLAGRGFNYLTEDGGTVPTERSAA